MEFLVKLEETLDQRRAYLNEQEIPKLRDSFHAYQTAFENVVTLFLRKSLIKEDPYKHEQKISEVRIPSSEPVLESEKSEQISLRLSDFQMQLDFLNNFYQLSVDFLNLSRVRLLSKLVNYIAWDKLSDVSGNINTKLVGELYDKIRQGSDRLSSGVLLDAQNQLTKATDDIISVLRELTSYHRERYKLDMRKQLFAVVDLDAQIVANQRQEVLKRLKSRFVQLSARGTRSGTEARVDASPPYYPELVAEILDEDYSEYGDNLKDGVIEKLQVHKTKPVKSDEPDFKPILLEAIRLVATAGIPMESALQKLVDNAQALEQKKLTLGAKIKRWLARLVGAHTPTKRTYEIELSDPETAITRVEKMDFTAYADRARKRCKILENVSNKMSSVYSKLREAEESQIHSFLSANLEDVYYLYSKMTGLDNYFKRKLGRDDKMRLKGIKMEISAVKNAVVKSNQKMHEYISRREEGEQLKRLGITDPPTAENAGP